jgi:hypothetical protein
LHQKVIKLVPMFKSILEACTDDPMALDSFITQVSAYMRLYICCSTQENLFQLVYASNSARQEDSASLKGNILQYMLPEPTVDILQPPLSTSHGKSARGFNHPMTAYYLCPVELVEKYADDME